MAHHAIDVILGVVIKGCPFRADLSYIFMILLTMRFLPGAHRITVVDAGPDHVIHAAFQYVRMSEFPAPVSEYQRERETELNRGDLLFQTVENCFYTFGLLSSMP